MNNTRKVTGQVIQQCTGLALTIAAGMIFGAKQILPVAAADSTTVVTTQPERRFNIDAQSQLTSGTTANLETNGLPGTGLTELTTQQDMHHRHRMWDDTHPADLSDIAEPATNAPAYEVRRHRELQESRASAAQESRPVRRALPVSGGTASTSSSRAEVKPERTNTASKALPVSRQQTTTKAAPAKTQTTAAATSKQPVYVSPGAKALPQTGMGDSRATTTLGLAFALLISLLGFIGLWRRNKAV
ncbi:LPXTG cell wall anchor domain-containing protein [Lacticaseibacillus pabuli]|uniref:LPXTG cell wall anchor domain-containing protein n=1 Tax=Lacticaseibacillus pabuli TaxID=3025672 RepID=A0ABY7WW05_9LACO|nr:LPXTG cell wall anchor domain-containing protein [Lacticaseibacillus sp. KACC 23028]WDF83315.1 LPXTG cell wall anchor domain-containing protein [Lacticaseibacillus sp. KACC 23028]